MNIFDIPNSN